MAEFIQNHKKHDSLIYQGYMPTFVTAIWIRKMEASFGNASTMEELLAVENECTLWATKSSESSHC